MSETKDVDSGPAEGEPGEAGAARYPVKDSALNPVVFFGSAALILALSLWAMIAPDSAEAVIGGVVGWISSSFGWYYFLAATIFVVFVVFIAASKYGSIKLGPEQAKPQFNLFTWTAMLFAAGIGIDLMFFSVSEPVSQYLSPPVGEGSSVEAARMAVFWTLFHYGITGWAMYALMGMALGYFAYRHNLPLSIRSALYPIIGKRIWGPVGDGVEIAAVLGTIFGIATSLGIGVVQLNYGLSFMFGVEENVGWQIALIALAVVMATVSVVSGVEKGIRRLSELNIVLAIGLMLFILISGRTGFLLNAMMMNIGDYASNFLDMTLNTFAFEAPTAWLNGWTLFFWAWWIAWAPFVGLFLARISRGRSIRQFVTGVMIIPFAFILIWISIFGNSALSIVMSGGTEFGEIAANSPERAFYTMLDQYPGIAFSAAIATFTGLLFYVTSADSGALVMSNFTSKTRHPAADGAKWLRVFWAAATGLLTLAMLIVGGVTTLQNATIIMGLPFSFVMFFVMIGLYKSLRVEGHRFESHRLSQAGNAAARVNTPERSEQRNWRQRLARSMSYPGRRQTVRYMDDVCRPALTEVSEELRGQGLDVDYTEGVVEATGLDRISLTVKLAGTSDFTYQLWPGEFQTPSFATRMQTSDDKYYRVEVYLTEGSQGYDVTGFTKEQIISDILDQYESHLHFLHLQREHRAAADSPDEIPPSNTNPG
ncbi:choline BCCT transporter BetT [Arthrobacter monumenti]